MGVDYLYTDWLEQWMDKGRLHPTYFYSGPVDAEIVVVGQATRGGDQPFAGMHETMFAWEGLGKYALMMGWTYVQEIPPQLLREKNGIITCGKKAFRWLTYFVDGDASVLQLPSPQYLLSRPAGRPA